VTRRRLLDIRKLWTAAIAALEGARLGLHGLPVQFLVLGCSIGSVPKTAMRNREVCAFSIVSS
jgi:hypothetical protein